MEIKRLYNQKTGELLAGFLIMTKNGKELAIGAKSVNGHSDFLIMAAKRYEHDLTLVKKIERMTGIRIKERA